MKHPQHLLASLVASLSALLACAVDQSLDAGSYSTEFEEVDQAVQASTVARLFAFRYGQWRVSHIVDSGTGGSSGAESGTSVATTVSTYSFGSSDDIPLVDPLKPSGGGLVTYGTSGDRLGKFLRDTNDNRIWDAADTWIRFKSDAQVGDQPFILKVSQRIQNGGNCSNGGYIAAVGIKRGSSWLIDSDGNGVYSPNSCDQTATFGNPTDIPVSRGTTLGAARRVGPYTQWFWDNDMSRSWTAGDSSTVFGYSNDVVPIGATSVLVGRNRDFFVDANNDGSWTNGTDLTLLAVVPSSYWLPVAYSSETVGN